MKINGFVPDSKVFDSLIKVDKKPEASQNSDFLSMLKEKLDEVNDKQINSDNISEQFLKGEGPDIHEVMLASEEAKMSLELAVQVRNKIVEAYQELNRMQL